MYEGELKKGMEARLNAEATLFEGDGDLFDNPEDFAWRVLAADCDDVVLRATDSDAALEIESLDDFREHLITLHDANGTQIYPEPKKAPEWKVGDLVSDAENDCGPCKIIAVRRRTETVLLACSLCDSEWERDFCALNPYEPPVDELVECLNQTSGERWDEQARDVIEQFIIIPRNQGD